MHLPSCLFLRSLSTSFGSGTLVDGNGSIHLENAKKITTEVIKTEGGKYQKKIHPHAKCNEGEGHGPGPPSNVSRHGGCVVVGESFLMFLDSLS